MDYNEAIKNNTELNLHVETQKTLQMLSEKES